jgi:hypothetical protein
VQVHRPCDVHRAKGNACRRRQPLGVQTCNAYRAPVIALRICSGATGHAARMGRQTTFSSQPLKVAFAAICCAVITLLAANILQTAAKRFGPVQSNA